MTKKDVIAGLTPKEKALYAVLVEEKETGVGDQWWSVYLDDAVVEGMSGSTRSGVFASLKKKGLYRGYDEGGYFGEVRV